MGALGKFLAMVKGGTVKPGSVLIVESLDRLSRDEVLKAFRVFSDMLEADITVHTSADSKTYTEKSVNDNPTDLMWSISIMARAHEESKIKSIRSTANWERKRELAVKNGNPMCGRYPAWIRIEDGKFMLIPERTRLIKRMVKWAIEGIGFRMMCFKMNDEKIPTWGNAKKGWGITMVQSILHSRKLIGECQPMTEINGKTVKKGEPIKGYFPDVLTEKEFYELQSALDSRKVIRGRSANTAGNIFGPIVYFSSGSRMIRCMSSRGVPIFRCNDALSGASKSDVIFQYDPIETHFLNWIRDIKMISSSPVNADVDKLIVESGRIGEKITQIEASIAKDSTGDITSLLKMNREFSKQKAEIDRQIETTRRESAKAEVSTDDITALLRQGNTPENRVKVRSAIGAVVNRITFNVFSNPQHPMERYISAVVEFNHNGMFRVRRMLIGTGRKTSWSIITGRIHMEHPIPFQGLKDLGQWVEGNAVGFMQDGKTYRLAKGGNEDNPVNRLMEASGMPSRFKMESAEHPGWKDK